MRLSSEELDYTRLEILKKKPRFSLSGKEVTNPYVYCAMEALERLAWYLLDLPLDAESSLTIRVWIEEENLSFRAVAELEESNAGPPKPLEARGSGGEERRLL